MRIKLVKIKVRNWCDNLIYQIHHIRRNIQRFFTELHQWFCYYKVVTNIYDFDFSSIVEVERYQIKRVRDTIAKYHSHVNWERDVRYIDLALKLLSIAMEEDSIVKQTSGHHWTEGPDEHGLYEWKSDAKYEATKYVNIRNAHRFSKMPMKYYTDSDIRGLHLDHLRVEKAWYLYHKLRTHHMREWWD